MRNNMSAIIVKNLSKHFFPSKKEKKGNKNKQFKPMRKSKNNVVRAVDNISFEVKEGEIFGFLGPNGAGKTTTIRMLTGVLKPTNGTILVFDNNFWTNPIRIKQIMGHVPEEANVYMDLSGLENLSFIGELYGMNKKERIARAEDLLMKFDLYEKRHFKAKKYSKGMKQRLLLCMALMSDPKILFLDEPTSGLDVQSSIIIKNIIKQYNKEGMTIFMTTHDMDVANEMCNRIAIINEGKLIGLDTPENLKKLKQEYQAIDFYFSQDINESELNNLKSIKQVQKIRDYYHIIVHDINDGACEIIEYMKSKGINIKKINTYEPHLEEVFIKMIKGED
ncbi:MAG: ATP-binding cassette domain-containing protein [Promethearchaeota archaeon]|nr:MAG: ATP-binding cassette domain-containing protein [Candidatus Lokiarchaeota archaeon]